MNRTALSQTELAWRERWVLLASGPTRTTTPRRLQDAARAYGRVAALEECDVRAARIRLLTEAIRA